MAKPEVFQRMLGASFVKKQGEPVLVVGDQVFDRFTMVHQLQCTGCYRAAQLLSKALKALGIKSATEAGKMDLTRLAKLRGVGVTTLYVMLSWLENWGGTGTAPSWYGENPGFSTVQKRERKRKKAR